jgi:hypothetical protein
MPDAPALVLAVECPACCQLSRLAWYQSLPVLPPHCHGCGREWTAAQVDALAVQLPRAHPALARALAEAADAEAPPPGRQDGDVPPPPPGG